ncbi:MAG: glycerophosphodiester phosphodiesterase [Thermodesulfobacteriota bacterium]
MGRGSPLLEAQGTGARRRALRDSRFFSCEPVPRLFAHRGASGHRPENTLEAFSLAVSMGVRYLELDVRMSLDGHVVVIHDDTLERTTDGRGSVREHDLAQLKRLDAGCKFVPGGSGLPLFKGKGVRIPTLDEVIREFPEAMLNIEVKQKEPCMVEALWEVIHRNRAMDRVLLAAEDGAVLGRLRERFGDGVASGISRQEAFRFARWYLTGKKGSLQLQGQALQIPQRMAGVDYITRGFIEAAHELGLEVHIWTVNERSRMRMFLEMGADGIMTDFPEMFQALMAQAPVGSS